jgi:hypothetical protein
MYSKIIAKRLTVIAEVLLLEEQNGFRTGWTAYFQLHK